MSRPAEKILGFEEVRIRERIWGSDSICFMWEVIEVAISREREFTGGRSSSRTATEGEG